MTSRVAGLVVAILSGLTLMTPLKSQSVRAAAQRADDPAGALRPGDVVQLRVWREPDLTGEFQVDRGGVVVIPKLGPYDVSRETPESLKARLVRDFGVYLKNPAIEVIVLRRVKIVGAVNEPGLHAVDPTMTLGDALALAGGVEARGRRDRIHVIRDGVVIVADLTENVRITDTPLRSGDEIYVPEKGWMRQNVGAVLLAASAVLGVLIPLLAR